MLNTDAPLSLRIPIRKVYCSTVKDASPNNPKHEMNKVRRAKYFTLSLISLLSIAYLLTYLFVYKQIACSKTENH